MPNDSHTNTDGGESGPTQEVATTNRNHKPPLFGNDEFFWSKAGYCGAYFGFSAVNPYYGVLFAAKGFAPDQIGWLAAAMPACLFTILPPMSYLSDRYRKGTTITNVAIVAASLTALVMTASSSLAVVAIAAILHFISTTPIYPLLDQHTMSLLPADRKTEWGTHRSYGAYGWGVGAPLASILIDKVGWAALPFQYLAGSALTGWAMVATPTENEPTTKRYGEVWMLLLSHSRMLLFLFCVVLMGMGYVLIQTFLFLFLEELEAPPILLGISITCTLLIEVPLFRSSAAIHERFSDKQLMSAAMIGWALRVFGYSLLQNPWLVLFFEPLHGATFGLMWLSGVHYMSTHFPKDLVSSAFGFLHGTAFGAGPIFGNIIGGHLYAVYGPRTMFRMTAAVMLVCCLLYNVLDRYLESTRGDDDALHDGENKDEENAGQKEPEEDAKGVDAQELRENVVGVLRGADGGESPRHAAVHEELGAAQLVEVCEASAVPMPAI